jgi:hypothetical protein
VLLATVQEAPFWLAAPGIFLGAYAAPVRRSSRIAFGISWLVYGVTVVLAWRKVLAVPDGRGDVTGLFVATVCGFAGLGLLGAWLSHHEGRRR